MSAPAKRISSRIPATTSPATAPAATKNGLYRIIGRVDDVINVSGHRFGTAEIENAINENDVRGGKSPWWATRTM